MTNVIDCLRQLRYSIGRRNDEQITTAYLQQFVETFEAEGMDFYDTVDVVIQCLETGHHRTAGLQTRHLLFTLEGDL